MPVGHRDLGSPAVGRPLNSRSRILLFGGAGAMVLAGLLCGVLVEGLAGQVLVIGLVTLGLGGALLLVFFEIGLSEDHERAREQERRRARARTGAPRRRRLPRPPRRPG